MSRLRLSKIILTLVMACSIFGAKSQVFEQGYSFASLGYGFPNFTNTWFKLIDIGTEENYSNGSFGPVHLKYEYGITDRLGLGLAINYATAKGSWEVTDTKLNSSTGVYEDVVYEEDLRLTSFNTLIRINWHWVDNDKVDFYTGLGVGYNSNKFKYTSTDPDFEEESEVESVNSLVNIIPVGYETTIGLRYMFSDNIGAYMELGWSKSLIQAGVTARF